MTHTLFAPGARFTLITLGCKVNQYESHALREAWLAAGLTEASDPALADIVCINSCAVTAKAVADVRSGVSRARRAAPDASIILTGCAAQVLAEELAALPGVTAVIPQDAKAELLSLAIPLYRGVKGPQAPCGDSKGATLLWPAFAVSGYDRSRALVKVQDGCSHRCTFCIVPLTRGPSRSRPATESLAEVRRLLDAGFREITLSGINLAQYGRDLASPHDFWDLAAYLDRELAPEWAGRARLRLSSLEPGQLDPKALEVLASARLIAPHLHLSLQSGSPDVLRRMGRGHYNPGLLSDFCANLARVWPRFGLGADILTGFPAETESEAKETENLVKSLPFTYAHVFAYSPRPGTWAATATGAGPAAVKKSRSARLRHLLAVKKDAFLRGCLDLPLVHVAWEGTDGGVNEFYSDCRFTGERPPERTMQRALLAACPVATDKGRLLVAYRPE